MGRKVGDVVDVGRGGAGPPDGEEGRRRRGGEGHHKGSSRRRVGPSRRCSKPYLVQKNRVGNLGQTRTRRAPVWFTKKGVGDDVRVWSKKGGGKFGPNTSKEDHRLVQKVEDAVRVWFKRWEFWASRYKNPRRVCSQDRATTLKIPCGHHLLRPPPQASGPARRISSAGAPR